MSPRFELAHEDGAFALPAHGSVRVYGAVASTDLSGFEQDRLEIVQPFKPDFDSLSRDGFRCLAEDPGTPVAGAVVLLPRSKDYAWTLISAAIAASTNWVAVDGAKTDGIDSVIKALRKQTKMTASIAKAHGKLVVFDPEGVRHSTPPAERSNEGFRTVPGVFSADGVDPASRLLADVLPGQLGKHVVDLGGGWGFLSSQILERTDVERLDLVEADARALDCARTNVKDPRATFHWADARSWQPDAACDAVVMNPPFHTGRATDPGLGRAFIAAAAQALKPNGQLWMVANRHLPYEAELMSRFRTVTELAGTSAFKILHGLQPSRHAR